MGGQHPRGTFVTNFLAGICSALHLIFQSLDSGADFPAHTGDQKPPFCLSVAHCLLQFLESLPEPIVPFSVQSSCVQAASRDEAFEVRPQTFAM